MCMGRSFGCLVSGLMISMVAISGCGPSGPPTAEVTGKVTFSGTPIEDGDISFHPEQGSKATTSSGPIKNGEYRLSGQSGLMPGTYSVRVNAYRAGKQSTNPDMPPDPNPRFQFLPTKFNTNSTIEKFVVEEGKSKIEKNLDLK